MTQDLFEQDEPQPGREPGGARGPGRLVLAGVVTACVAGVALGFWARPAAPGEVKPHPKAPPAAATPTLQVVVDEGPAPIGAPLEVLPAGVAHAAAPAPPPPMLQVEPMAPRRPASGLVKVDAPLEPPPAPTPIQPPKPKRDLAAEQKAARLAAEHEKAARAEAARQQTADARLAKVKLAQAQARKAAELAAAARAEKEARAEQARADRQARLEKAKADRLAKLDRAKAAKLVQARTQAQRPKAQPAVARADARPRRLTDLVKAVKAEAREIVRRKPVQVAREEPKAKPAPAKVAKAAPPPKKPVLRGQGPLRVARADACASSDPGEALVCADARLGARDRQLQQAYRNAEAAGVDAASLRRQQARWLQARAAAAREAPWAVEDVYVARISELRDQARDAGREN